LNAVLRTGPPISHFLFLLHVDDIESAFIDAGANAFTMKPFPCKAQALKAEVLRIWNSGCHLKMGFQDFVETSTTVIEAFDFHV
jgi:hypothetical protein